MNTVPRVDDKIRVEFRMTTALEFHKPPSQDSTRA